MGLCIGNDSGRRFGTFSKVKKIIEKEKRGEMIIEDMRKALDKNIKLGNR